MLAVHNPRIHGLEVVLSSTISKASKPKPFDTHTKYFACIIIVVKVTMCEHIPIPMPETDFDIVAFFGDIEPVQMGEPTDLIFNRFPVFLPRKIPEPRRYLYHSTTIRNSTGISAMVWTHGT